MKGGDYGDNLNNNIILIMEIRVGLQPEIVTYTTTTKSLHIIIKLILFFLDSKSKIFKLYVGTKNNFLVLDSKHSICNNTLDQRSLTVGHDYIFDG